MRRKALDKAKLVIEVESDRISGKIHTVSVFDNRTGKHWTPEQVAERGIEWFLSLADMKETLNWNLNGDESRYQFVWKQSCKTRSSGTAYVFN